MDFSTRFLPPNPSDENNPPCCEECNEERDDCGADCGRMAQWFLERDEEIRQAEIDHPLNDFVKTREKLMDQHMEPEI